MANRSSTLLSALSGPWPFGILLAINIAFTFSTTFYPTCDGPSHLHNAQLLDAWYTGDPAVRGSLEHVGPVPNWLDHAILLSFLQVLPARLAEKAFIILYLCVFAFGIRRLIRTLAPENVGLALLAFPLLHSHLFHLGFYNFCFGLALMCHILAIGLDGRPGSLLKRWSWLCLLSTALYFSNALAFGISAFILGWAATWRSYHSNASWKERRNSWLREAGFLLTAFLPGMLSFAWFTQVVSFGEPYELRGNWDLLGWLVKSYVIQLHDTGNTLYGPAFALILLAFLTARLLLRGPAPGNVLLLPTIVIGILFFTVPDGAQAGMMNDRYGVLFLLMVVLWVASTVRISTPILALAAVAGFGHLGLQQYHLQVTRNPWDALALQVHDLAEHVPTGSAVYPIPVELPWYLGHHCNYLSVDRPLLMLGNYEARLGWFPLRWRADRPQWRCLGDPQPPPCSASADEQLPPYVLLYGSLERWNDARYTTVRELLDSSYAPVPNATKDMVQLYRLRNADLPTEQDQ